MGPVGRGNSLEDKVLEYCIHGLFKRTETDVNGTHGACWVPLRQLYTGQTLTNDDFSPNLTVEQLDNKIEVFEAEQKELLELVLQQVEVTGAHRTRSLNEVSRRQDAPMRYFKRSWLY